MTPTARSLDYCRKLGLVAGVVERWNAHAGIRQDLFGFIDILVLDGGILAVQATSGANAAARVAKIRAEPRAAAWLAAGGRVEVWAWRTVVARRKDGSRAKRKRWELRRVVVDRLDS